MIGPSGRLCTTEPLLPLLPLEDVVEPLPEPEPEPEPVAPVVVVEPEPLDVVEPLPEPEPVVPVVFVEPLDVVEPEPLAPLLVVVEPEPLAVVELESLPPEVVVEPEPLAVVEPESLPPEVVVEPEPLVVVEPALLEALVPAVVEPLSVEDVLPLEVPLALDALEPLVDAEAVPLELLALEEALLLEPVLALEAEVLVLPPLEDPLPLLLDAPPPEQPMANAAANATTTEYLRMGIPSARKCPISPARKGRPGADFSPYLRMRPLEGAARKKLSERPGDNVGTAPTESKMASVKSVSIGKLRGLTASEVSGFEKAGVKTSAALLQAAPDAAGERALAKKAGLTYSEVHEAANRADLVRVSGIGGATADLFENAGVNSVLELSHRSAASLERTLQAYVAAHPEAHLHAPGLKTVAQLINGAKQVISPAPTTITQDAARPIAAAALNRYIDEVLFSDDPEGASFRSMALDGHTDAEKEAVRAALHGAVGAFVGDGSTAANSELEEIIDGGDKYTFVGRFDGLYTEVDVGKDGKPGRVYVEID